MLTKEQGSPALVARGQTGEVPALRLNPSSSPGLPYEVRAVPNLLWERFLTRWLCDGQKSGPGGTGRLTPKL